MLRSGKKLTVLDTLPVHVLKKVISILVVEGGWIDYPQDGIFAKNGKFNELDVVEIV